MKRYIKYIIIILLTGFALLTLFLSTSVILDLFNIRAKEGNYVLFVVYANFIASLLYLWAIIRSLKETSKPALPLYIAILILFIAQLALFFHIKNGGIYEEKTVSALYFRMGVTFIFALLINYFKKIKIK